MYEWDSFPEAYDRMARLRRAVESSSLLHSFVRQVEAEFDKLPFFIRPMARSNFHRNAGQSVSDWIRTAADLHHRLRLVEAGDPRAEHSLRGVLPHLEAQLHHLISYCRAIPGETARFTSDTRILRSLSEAMDRRVELIRGLINELRFLSSRA
jgi:hypothetical protein